MLTSNFINALRILENSAKASIFIILQSSKIRDLWFQKYIYIYLFNKDKDIEVNIANSINIRKETRQRGAKPNQLVVLNTGI